MPDVTKFKIGGLAGRKEVVAHELNSSINIFFGPNGSGKTSLLRILHSALSNDASVLKPVPFDSAEIVVYSYGNRSICTYSISKSSARIEDKAKHDSGSLRAKLLKKEDRLAWSLDPSDGGAWFHMYLPIARLYERPRDRSETPWLGIQQNDTEETLESRFAENLRNTWKDYSAQITSKVNQIQEAGLARILASVIARSESHLQTDLTDPAVAFQSVTNFLSRRRMDEVNLTYEEFLRRYKKDQRLRSIATDIEAIEREIAEVMAPRDALKQLISEMFIGNKVLSLSENGIDVDIEGKNIELSLLSSGEKQLLKILVDTVIAGPSIVLIDEPELSMHIDWQRRLVPSMHLLNPHAQLIIATHSPEIMAEIPDEQIFRI